MNAPGNLERELLKAAEALLAECQRTGRDISCNVGDILPQSGAKLPVSVAERLLKELQAALEEARRPRRVGFLGPAASFTHQAALETFGVASQLEPLATIEEVFAEVERGNVDVGVVPVENALQGVVTWTLDSFLSHEIYITGEVRLAIHQNLLGKGDLETVNRVYSHPQAFAQARKWLATYLPKADLVPVASTAKGAEQAAEDAEAAAIGTELAAEQYGLKVLARSIEDVPGNTTRFLVLEAKSRKISAGETSAWKTSLAFSTQHEPGALYEALTPFHDFGVNMTMIESRPTRHLVWHYVFFVDIEGRPDEGPVKQALEAMRPRCLFLRLLGTYPSAPQPAETKGNTATEG